MIDWDYALRCLPELMRGLAITVYATGFGMMLALIVGLAWALLGQMRSTPIRVLVRGIVELLRSTPLLVQLYFAFYVLPGLGVTLSPLATGVVGIGMHYSAYLSEVYRAGIAALPGGQWEAAAVLGLSRVRTYASVVLPQAIPPMLPMIGNYAIAMFKDTPMLSAITVLELLARAKLLGAAEFRYLEPLTLVGLLFLAVSIPTSCLTRWLERRYVTT
jgi:polar amino acid transport system permease protein